MAEAGLSGTTLTAVVAVLRKGSPSSIDLVHVGDCRLSVRWKCAFDETTQLQGTWSEQDIDVHEIEETSGKNTLTKHIGDEAGSKGGRLLTGCGWRVSSPFCVAMGSGGPYTNLMAFGSPTEMSPPCQSAVEEIVHEAIERGSTDNCSALIVDLALEDLKYAHVLEYYVFLQAGRLEARSSAPACYYTMEGLPKDGQGEGAAEPPTPTRLCCTPTGLRYGPATGAGPWASPA